MKILLTGSTGFIGRHIYAALLEQGHEVVTAERRNGIDFNLMTDPGDWFDYLDRVDVVINAVGIIVDSATQSFQNIHALAPAALFHACEQVNVSRVIQVSALGADNRGITPYHKSKKAGDDVLRLSSLDWFILRPSLVYGEDGSSTRFFRMLARLPLLPLTDGGQQLIQPVHIDDLVEVVLACLNADKTKKTIDVAGPQVMTLAEWIQCIRKQSGKPASRIVSLPYLMMLQLSQFLRYIVPLFSPDNLRMLQQGNTSSDTSVQEILGRAPRVVP